MDSLVRFDCAAHMDRCRGFLVAGSGNYFGEQPMEIFLGNDRCEGVVLEIGLLELEIRVLGTADTQLAGI